MKYIVGDIKSVELQFYGRAPQRCDWYCGTWVLGVGSWPHLAFQQVCHALLEV